MILTLCSCGGLMRFSFRECKRVVEGNSLLEVLVMLLSLVLPGLLS